LIPFGILCFLVAATLTFAATIPNSFTAGDSISASQKNENFAYIMDQLNSFSAPGSAYSNNAAAPTSSVHVDALGNVGIGTSSPTAMLDVAGEVKATSFSGVFTLATDTFYTSDVAPPVGSATAFTAGVWSEYYQVGSTTTAISFTIPSTGNWLIRVDGYSLQQNDGACILSIGIEAPSTTITELYSFGMENSQRQFPSGGNVISITETGSYKLKLKFSVGVTQLNVNGGASITGLRLP
jgi:hypothetical protein